MTKKSDILDPAEIAKGMKRLGLKGDEPHPGWSGGRELPKPPQPDEPDTEDAHMYFGFNFLDYRP